MRLARRTQLLAATALISLPLVTNALAETPAQTPTAETAAAAVPSAAGAAATKPIEELAKDYTIIKIGSDEIRNSEVVEIWKGLFPGGAAPDFNNFDENIRQNVLRGMISEKLIFQEAQKAGFDKNEEVKKRLAMLEKQVIMQAFMEQKAKELVTDDQLKAAYNEKLNAAKGQEEINARHILVATEEEAKKIAEEAKKNADFAKLAKEKSTDKGSGANGGELGWFTKDKMVPEFAEAAFKLQKGEISGPVKSPFGYHVIKVEDRRAVTIGTFEDLKESLKGDVANKMIQNYLEGMLKAANIKYFSADGKEKPFSTSLTPPTDGAVAN
jgi:peptidyl-prolyl cis-trans isomerase C